MFCNTVSPSADSFKKNEDFLQEFLCCPTFLQKLPYFVIISSIYFHFIERIVGSNFQLTISGNIWEQDCNQKVACICLRLDSAGARTSARRRDQRSRGEFVRVVPANEQANWERGACRCQRRGLKPWQVQAPEEYVDIGALMVESAIEY